MYRLPVDNFRGYFYVVIAITAFSWKVLAAVDQPTLDAAGQRWFEKGWKPTTSANYADSAVLGGVRSRSKMNGHGSGTGPISDLDEGASGLGEDDEDTETEMGSGIDSSNSRFDVGSGHDIGLPPTFEYPSTSTETTPVEAITEIATETSSKTTPEDVVTSEEPELTTIHVTERSTITSITSTTRKMTTAPKFIVPETTPTQRRTSTEPIFTARSTHRPTTVVPPRKDKPSVLDDRNKSLPANFWMRPGVLAGLIGGAIAGLLAAILLVMFVVYRMRKKDEGSYALEEPKSPPTYAYAYQKAPTREFYA